MKKAVLTLCAAILSIGAFFTGCDKTAVRDRINKIIDVTLPENAMIIFVDTHGGFLGDGTFSAKVTFLDEDMQSFLALIKEKNWTSLPLMEDVGALFYGGILDAAPYDFYGREIGKPEAENGYWFFHDRNSERSKKLLERYSFNFTLAILDTDTNALYVYALDT